MLNEYYNFISTNLILRIKKDFEMFAARNSKEFQEMSSLEELGKTERNLRGSYKFIGNFIKKDTLTQVFSCEFCKTFKNTFL